MTEAIIKKVADLIKIRIPEAELGKYAKQLSTVLGSIDILKELKTDEVAITSQTHGLENVMQEDEVEPSLNMDEYRNIKNFQKGYFVVKKVL